MLGLQQARGASSQGFEPCHLVSVYFSARLPNTLCVQVCAAGKRLHLGSMGLILVL